jgi:5-methylcytosine-specific restriction protein B
MNLAHVERYFADALSGMESREAACIPNLRVGSDGVWREASGDLPLLPFPRNLAVIGTVNVDETTYLFSPKVLDRANTFEFRVQTADLQDTARRPVDLTPGDPSLVRGFQVIASSDEWHLQNPAPWADDFSDQLRVLHKLLAEASLEFGHRIYFESMRFAAMHVAAGEPSLEAALDRQVLQKILPRLHGARRRLEATLCALGRYCQDLAYEPGSAYPGAPITFDPTRADQEVAKLPSSLDKIRRMTLTLRANQFTSFTD